MVRETTPTFEELSALLLQEELRRQGSGTKSSKNKDEAFTVRGRPWRGRGRGGWNRNNERQNQGSHQEGGDSNSAYQERNQFVPRGRGGYRGNLRGRGRSSYTSRRGPCYYCGKDGHVESECRIKQHAQQSRGRGRGFSNWQRQNRNNFVGEGNQNDERNYNNEFLLMASHTNQSHYRGEWYVDSGATAHMTGNGDWFSQYIDEKGSNKVVLGDDSTQTIQGYGDIPRKW